MGPKKDNDSSKVKRKNSNIMIDVKEEIIAKHENGIRVSDLAPCYLLIPFQTITFHFLTTFHLRRQLSSIPVR
jgi:hypothetical protein